MGTQTITPPSTAPAPANGGEATAGAGAIGASLYPGNADLHHPPAGVVEIRKPSSQSLEAYWRAELRDQYGVDPGSIISVNDPFVVAFHVWLTGDLWRCICGDWCFDMSFESIGGGAELSLSDFPNIEPQLSLTHWKGCAPGARHFWVTVTIPAGTVPAGPKNKLYRVAATFQMLDPCGKPVPVVGYQSLGEFQFYNS